MKRIIVIFFVFSFVFMTGCGDQASVTQETITSNNQAGNSGSSINNETTNNPTKSSCLLKPAEFESTSTNRGIDTYEYIPPYTAQIDPNNRDNERDIQQKKQFENEINTIDMKCVYALTEIDLLYGGSASIQVFSGGEPTELLEDYHKQYASGSTETADHFWQDGDHVSGIGDEAIYFEKLGWNQPGLDIRKDNKWFRITINSDSYSIQGQKQLKELGTIAVSRL